MSKKASKADWAEYDHHFWKLCQEKGWKPELAEDDMPILRSGRSGDCYEVYPHSPGRYGCCILAEHGKTKQAIIRKMIKAKLPRLNEDGTIFHEDILEGETDAIVFFSEDRLPRAVKTLNLKRKRRKAPSKEQTAKAVAALAKYREEQKRKKEDAERLQS